MTSDTLYISDLDGTLLDPDSRISETSAEIISEASGKGAMFSVATARTPATVVPLMRNIHSEIPLIVMTGAAMWDRRENRYINPKFIPRDNAGIILDAFKKASIDPFIYCLPENSNILQVFHGAELSKPETEFYLERRNMTLKHFNLGQKPDDALLGRILLIFGFDTTARINPLAESLRQKDICSVSSYPDIFNSERSLIEVFNKGVSKASAIKELKKFTNASRVVVFGDNLNDLPMFEVADEAVAVDNAMPGVKEKADRVIGPNSRDSVAKFILNDFMEGKR